MGIHYMDATTVEECWRLLRQTGKSNSYESLANLPRYTAVAQGPGLDRRLRTAQGEPPAGRAQRPGEALGAQEPLAHDRARRADDRLPGRADRLHAPRPGHLHRVVLLALGRDDRRPLRRPTSAASSATPSSTCGRAPSTPSTTRGRSTTRRSSSTSRSPTCATTRSGSPARIYDQFGLDWTPEVQTAIEEIDRESKQGKAAPKHNYTSRTTGSPSSRSCAAFDR